MQFQHDSEPEESYYDGLRGQGGLTQLWVSGVSCPVNKAHHRPAVPIRPDDFLTCLTVRSYMTLCQLSDWFSNPTKEHLLTEPLTKPF